METLFYELSILANQALDDQHFDPSKIEDLMALFEQEAYISSSSSELHHETTMTKVENQLNALMDEAMEEYYKCCEEAERCCQEEMSALLDAAERAKKLGQSLSSAASILSKKYIDAARSSAVATMKSAFSSVSKVHPNNN
ncbi:hypothetical protein IHE45_06G025400 [Dioscorea alata]|uniref:Uncharacterized protein n=1 Tax=Dioscorea alata TaxID=55571 RepID=A0ACB7VW59_DIOAL|nr:hypothetical protein IHE45_06G025400 [Dioscorea alata]